MAKKEKKRDYNFSDATLSGLSNQFLAYAARDTGDLTPRGYTPADATNMNAKLVTFNGLLPNSYYVGQITDAVADKDAARGELELAMDAIISRVVQVHGYDNTQYTQFDVAGYSGFSDDQLVSAANRVHTIGLLIYANYSAQGMTQAMVNLITPKLTDFNTKLALIGIKVNDQDEATDLRVEKGNELYADLVILARAGQQTYKNTNPAKQNDYVIYETTASGFTKVKAFVGETKLVPIELVANGVYHVKSSGGPMQMGTCADSNAPFTGPILELPDGFNQEVNISEFGVATDGVLKLINAGGVTGELEIKRVS
ncbi:MAG: hypothetical protein NTX03_07030 [Bacteroidetes bacterium]|nr:hypothetical protein [Bacteroidota bacterium]